MQTIAKDLQSDIRDVTSTSKSKWKKKVKGKAIDRIRKRMKGNMQKKQNDAHYGMTGGKGNKISKNVKVIP